MKKSVKFTALLAILIFAGTAIADAQNYRRTNNRMSYKGQCLDIPGLTDQQREQILAINTAHQKTIDQMRADFWAAEDITVANEIKAKMTLEQNKHLKKISEVLNEEQLKYFNENIIAGPAGGKGQAYNRGGRGNGRAYAYGQGYGRGGRCRDYNRPAGRRGAYGYGRW